MTDNVKISVGLLNQTIDFLESLAPLDFDPILAIYHRYVLQSLLQKKQALERRKSLTASKISVCE